MTDLTFVESSNSGAVDFEEDATKAEFDDKAVAKFGNAKTFFQNLKLVQQQPALTDDQYKEVLVGMMRGFSKTQTLTVEKQLQIGVRAFDFRVRKV